MRRTALLALAAFLMPRCSAIHAWETVVFFHSNPLQATPFPAPRQLEGTDTRVKPEGTDTRVKPILTRVRSTVYEVL